MCLSIRSSVIPPELKNLKGYVFGPPFLPHPWFRELRQDHGRCICLHEGQRGSECVSRGVEREGHYLSLHCLFVVRHSHVCNWLTGTGLEGRDGLFVIDPRLASHGETFSEMSPPWGWWSELLHPHTGNSGKCSCSKPRRPPVVCQPRIISLILLADKADNSAVSSWEYYIVL